MKSPRPDRNAQATVATGHLPGADPETGRWTERGHRLPKWRHGGSKPEASCLFGENSRADEAQIPDLRIPRRSPSSGGPPDFSGGPWKRPPPGQSFAWPRAFPRNRTKPPEACRRDPPFPGMDLGNGFLSSLVAPRAAGGASRSVGATQPAHRTSWARFPSFPGMVFRPSFPLPHARLSGTSPVREIIRRCPARALFSSPDPAPGEIPGNARPEENREGIRRRGRPGSPRSVDRGPPRGRDFRSLWPQAFTPGRRTGRGLPIPAPETEAFEELHPCGRCRPPRGGSSSPRRDMPERGPFAFSIPSPLMSASRASCGGRRGRAGAFLRPPTPPPGPSPGVSRGIPGERPGSGLPAPTALSVPDPSPGSRETPG